MTGGPGPAVTCATSARDERLGGVPTTRSTHRLRDTDLRGSVHPVLRDHHLHLGLLDEAALGGLPASGIGAAVDLGWSPDVVALAERAPLRVHYAGGFLTAPDGYPGGRPWAPHAAVRALDGPDDAADAVEEQRRLGASVVKVVLNRDDGPVPDLATLQAVVRAADARGLTVVAHVQGAGMVELAVPAGVAALAHTPWTHPVDPDVVAECVAAGMAWISTLDIHGYGTRTPEQEQAVANLRSFHAAGGRVLYGTDLGNGPLPVALNLRELALLREAGLDDAALLDALSDPWPGPVGADVVTFLPGEADEDLLVRLAAARVVPATEVESL